MFWEDKKCLYIFCQATTAVALHIYLLTILFKLFLIVQYMLQIFV